MSEPGSPRGSSGSNETKEFSTFAERYAPAYDLGRFITDENRRAVAPLELTSFEVRDLWADYLEEQRTGRAAVRFPAHFYLHVPYCRQRCAYCCCYSVALTRERDLEDYVESLARQMDFFAPTFAGVRFGSLFVGGGTPSLLSPSQMRRLLGVLFTRCAFDAKGERTVECNPGSVTRRKVELLKGFGINRISMGVQSLDAAALRLENRGYQGRAMVYEAVRLVQEAGLQLNLDLLLGLRGDSRAIFLKTLAAALRMEPDQVSIYCLTPTPRYLEAFYFGEPSRFSDAVEERYGGLFREIASIARPEYVLRWGSLDRVWELTRRDTPFRWTLERDDLFFRPRPASLFGLGPSAHSRITGRWDYRQKEDLEPSFEPARPLYQGVRVDLRHEMLRYVLMQLEKQRGVPTRRFRRYFGVAVDSVFPEAVGALTQRGLLVERQGWLRATARSRRELFLSGLHFVGRAALDA